ncbi:hypothetical protein B0H16DRAFT_1749045 [Mycena metata]|uniref:Uncharacterized protein n=1 Tax=Mycena metata TaxID=1033252 RepID=A0AAD7DXG3_9AGAR|nr:hypothetical protein B0H16DRAFT_1749045 [Mycena metata]
MTSFETNQCLLNLEDEKPKLWKDLRTKSTHGQCPGDDEVVAEDLEQHEDEEMGDDDSEIPTREVVEHVVTKKTRKNRVVKGAKGGATVGLGSAGDAEDAEAEIVVAEDGVETGKRKRRANPKYADFWRHTNDSGNDLAVPGMD